MNKLSKNTRVNANDKVTTSTKHKLPNFYDKCIFMACVNFADVFTFLVEANAENAV